MPEQTAVTKAYKAYNKILTPFAREYKFTFIDIASHWSDESNENRSLYTDGMHPNDKDYDLMAKIISNRIERNLKLVQFES